MSFFAIHRPVTKHRRMERKRHHLALMHQESTPTWDYGLKQPCPLESTSHHHFTDKFQEKEEKSTEGRGIIRARAPPDGIVLGFQDAEMVFRRRLLDPLPFPPREVKNYITTQRQDFQVPGFVPKQLPEGIPAGIPTPFDPFVPMSVEYSSPDLKSILKSGHHRNFYGRKINLFLPPEEQHKRSGITSFRDYEDGSPQEVIFQTR